jgi:hypothetical protein
VDGRADLFSLGCVLYHAVTGEPPFKGANLTAMLLAIVHDAPRPVRQLTAGVPKALERVILRLLCKRPGDRYSSARAVVEALHDVKVGGGSVRGAPPAYWPGSAVAVAVLLALGSLAYFFGQGHLDQPPPVVEAGKPSLPPPVPASKPDDTTKPAEAPKAPEKPGRADAGGGGPPAVPDLTPGRADCLDDLLIEQAPKIVEALRGRGYQNVGVLRFRVRLGSGKETFDAGAINGNLATRLQNALVIHCGSDETGALGILHDASTEAAGRGVGNWYSEPAERRKLFDVPGYPLAWGSRKVQADAFLTGILTVSPDLERAAVSVEAFSARDPDKAEKLAAFDFETDVSLLHDLGKSYSVVVPDRGPVDAPMIRWLILDAIRKHDAASGGPDPKEGTGADGIMVDDVEFKVLADGKPMPIKANGHATAECPETTAKVAFRLTNRSKEKTLGIDVRLNGVSLLLEQTAPPENCRVWVLKPGKTCVLRGYYVSETDLKNVAPFTMLVGDEARQKKSELGDQAGEIQVHVFGPAEPDDGPKAISRSLRGLPPSDRTAHRDLAVLQESLMRGAALKRVVQETREGGRVVTRELVVKDEAAEKRLTEKLKAVDFPRTPAPVASRVVKIVARSAE